MRLLLCAAAALALAGCSTHHMPQRHGPAADAGIAPKAGGTQAVPAAAAAPAAAVKAAAPIGYVQKFLWQAEHEPRVRACGAESRVALTGATPGLELYSAQCANGEELVLRCEWSTCRVLR